MRNRCYAALLVIALAVSMPATAQTIDVFVRGVRSAPEGSSTVRGGAAKIELASGNGGEVGVNLFWGGRLSTELAAASVQHDLDATAFGQHVDLGATRVTPISLLFQLHSNPQGTVDLHVGAGAAIVIIKDIANTPELQLLGVQAIRFHDRIAPAADAGLDLHLTPHWALTIAARYLDIRSKTTATYADGTQETAGLALKQLSVGAGLACRF
jgi:outer membrane protein W